MTLQMCAFHCEARQPSCKAHWWGSRVLRSVCLSVCEHISGTAGPIFTKAFVQIPCGHGSVLLWQRCDTLCTSGFMDDVALGCNGPYGDVWLVALRYRGGVWCLWMPYFVSEIVLCIYQQIWATNHCIDVMFYRYTLFFCVFVQIHILCVCSDSH